MVEKITEEKFNIDSLAMYVATIVDIFEQPPARDGPDSS